MTNHRTACRIARNCREAKDQSAYLKRKARQYGSATILLAERYLTALETAEKNNPGRCMAHVDSEARKIIEGTP